MLIILVNFGQSSSILVTTQPLHSLDDVPALRALPGGGLLVRELRHARGEAAVVRVVIAALLLRLPQQPRAVAAQRLVPRRHVVLRTGAL